MSQNHNHGNFWDSAAKNHGNLWDNTTEKHSAIE